MNDTKPIQKMTTAPVDHDIISWTTEEFQHHPKTAFWYFGFTVIAAALLIYSFFAGDFMTIAVFVLIVVLIFGYSHRKPRVVLHQLTPSGIVLDETLYPYKNIHKFWIVYEPPLVKTINIETTAMLNNHVNIQLGDTDPMIVKTYLKKYLTEDLEQDESIVDILTRILKI